MYRICAMNTWTIVDVCQMRIEQNKLIFVDAGTKWKYTSDIPEFKYIDPDLIPDIIGDSIHKHQINIQKNGQEEILITIPYKTYGKETILKFQLLLTEKYILDNLAVSATIIELNNKIDKLMAIIQDNEAFLLFPTIDPVDFMKFVNMYCIFEAKDELKNRYGNRIYKTEKHGITYDNVDNKLIFDEDIDKKGNGCTSEGGQPRKHILDLNLDKITSFQQFQNPSNYVCRGNSWYDRIILNYLSLKYMYNYYNGSLIEKNKRYIYINIYDGFQHYIMNEHKYKYTIADEYLKKRMGTFKNSTSNGSPYYTIHEVYDFEKWW